MKTRMIIDAIDKSRSKWYVQETMSMPSIMPSEQSDTTSWTKSGFLRMSVRSSRPWRSSDDIPSPVNSFVGNAFAYTPTREKEFRQKQMHELLPKENSKNMENENTERSRRRLQNATHEGALGFLESEEILQTHRKTSKQRSSETEEYGYMAREKFNEILAGFEESMDRNKIKNFQTDQYRGSDGGVNHEVLSLSDDYGDTAQLKHGRCQQYTSPNEDGQSRSTLTNQFKTFRTEEQRNGLEQNGTRYSDEIWVTNTFSETSEQDNASQISTAHSDSKELAEVELNLETIKSVKEVPVASYGRENQHMYSQIPHSSKMINKQDFSKDSPHDSLDMGANCYASKLYAKDDENMKGRKSLGHIKSGNRTEKWAKHDDEPIFADVPCPPKEINHPQKAREGNTSFDFKAKMDVDKVQENSRKVQSGVKEALFRDDGPIYSQLPCRQPQASGKPLKIPKCVDKQAMCDDEPIYAKVPVSNRPPVFMVLPNHPSKPQPTSSSSLTSNILADGQISRRLTRCDIALSNEEFFSPDKSSREAKPNSYDQDSTAVVDSAYQKYLREMLNLL